MGPEEITQPDGMSVHLSLESHVSFTRSPHDCGAPRLQDSSVKGWRKAQVKLDLTAV